jgi:hypothetical protein
LGSWQLRFPAGNYIARIAGGNLVGGPGGDPIAYTAGVQALLIQSAASTVVYTTSESPQQADIDAIRAVTDALSVVAGRVLADIRAVNGVAITGAGVPGDSMRPA